MATLSDWIEGARPWTLPNAIAPVLVGSGVAVALGSFSWWQSTLAMLVSLSLIVGVNFANDYSDGVRGTDAERVGPMRLVGSGTAAPQRVLAAALTALGFAGVMGLVLVAASGRWWLLLMGAVCLAGAWFYTGGRKPYGYSGFGEIAVFAFFGLAGVLGTVYVQAGTVDLTALACAVSVGCFSAAVLVANNLRDIPSDTATGKRTLAVLLGDTGSRRLYLGLVSVPLVLSVLLGIGRPPLLLGLVAAVLLVSAARAILRGRSGLGLIPVLRDTALAMLAWAVLTGGALVVA